MFTKGYSRRVGLRKWEPCGFATGEGIRRGREELQVSAGRGDGAVPDGRGVSVKQGKLCRALEDPGGKGGGGKCTGGQQVGAGLGPPGAPATGLSRTPEQPRTGGGAAAAAAVCLSVCLSIAVTRSLEKGKLSCEKINIISSRIGRIRACNKEH